jgi:hypothetical protein
MCLLDFTMYCKLRTWIEKAKNGPHKNKLVLKDRYFNLCLDKIFSCNFFDFRSLKIFS